MIFEERTVRGQVGSAAAKGDYARWKKRQGATAMRLKTVTHEYIFPPSSEGAVDAFLLGSETMSGSSRRKRNDPDRLGGYGTRAWGTEFFDEPRRNENSDCDSFSGAGGLFLPKPSLRQPRGGVGDTYNFGSIGSQTSTDVTFSFAAQVVYEPRIAIGSVQLFENPIGRKYSQSVYIYLFSGSLKLSIKTSNLFPGSVSGNISPYPLGIVSMMDLNGPASGWRGTTYESKLLGLNTPPFSAITPQQKSISASGRAQIGISCDLAAATPDQMESNKCLLSEDDLQSMQAQGYDGAFLAETHFGTSSQNLVVAISGIGIWSPDNKKF